MIFKHFRFRCIIRVILLGITLCLLFYTTFEITSFAMTFILAVVAVYQMYGLIHFVEKTNRDLTRFLESIRYSDFSQSFTGRGLGSSFDELRASFSEVLNAFRRTRSEKEEQYRYLQTVVQHVGMGLISFHRDGEVELVNTAAKRLLGVPRLKNIHSLSSSSEPLVDAMLRMKSGEKTLVKVENCGEMQQLALYATEFKLGGENLTLVSLQNIQSELEEKEMEAWQNLIRVLTHEIMNSITPISSLASTAQDMLYDVSNGNGNNGSVSMETIDDIRGAVQTIERRSQGLLHFVESYRKLTRLPKPYFHIVPVSTLFERVQQLMNGQLKDKSIHFSTHIEPETLELTADPELIEQVLINIVLNAIEAVDNQPGAAIKLRSHLDGGRVIIQASDNGPGIVEEALEKIFIPFFTTKKDGSGIGLSLSRQIMRLHRGSMSVQSKAFEETVFTLKF
ncbi:MAG: GHKL domain-containing protein [Gemmatimonadota bacterium]|nr:MAG: GHKL domain-containing protein [Gemmatimonadota bacterium]